MLGDQLPAGHIPNPQGCTLGRCRAPIQTPPKGIDPTPVWCNLETIEIESVRIPRSNSFTTCPSQLSFSLLNSCRRIPPLNEPHSLSGIEHFAIGGIVQFPDVAFLNPPKRKFSEYTTAFQVPKGYFAAQPVGGRQHSPIRRHGKRG